MKKTLITGGTEFMGSPLTKKLIRENTLFLYLIMIQSWRVNRQENVIMDIRDTEKYADRKEMNFYEIILFKKIPYAKIVGISIYEKFRQ